MRFTEYLHKNIFKHKSLWELFLPTPRELSELTGTFSFINISSSSWSRPSTGTMCAVAELRRKKKNKTTVFHLFLSWQVFPVPQQFSGTNLLPALGPQPVPVWEGLTQELCQPGDTVLHARDSLNDICIEKCLPSVCSSSGTTQMWVQVF